MIRKLGVMALVAMLAFSSICSAATFKDVTIQTDGHTVYGTNLMIDGGSSGYVTGSAVLAPANEAVDDYLTALKPGTYHCQAKVSSSTASQGYAQGFVLFDIKNCN